MSPFLYAQNHTPWALQSINLKNCFVLVRIFFMLKADGAGELTPGRENNAAARKIGRND